MEAAGAISEQLVARVKASLERRTAKEADFKVEGAWDEEDSDLLEEEIAPEEVGVGVRHASNIAGEQSFTDALWYVSDGTHVMVRM